MYKMWLLSKTSNTLVPNVSVICSTLFLTKLDSWYKNNQSKSYLTNQNRYVSFPETHSLINSKTTPRLLHVTIPREHVRFLSKRTLSKRYCCTKTNCKVILHFLSTLSKCLNCEHLKISISSYNPLTPSIVKLFLG